MLGMFALWGAHYFTSQILPALHNKGVKIVLKLPHPAVNPPKVTSGLLCKKEIFRTVLNSGCLVQGVSKSKFLSNKNRVLEPIIEKISASYPSVIFWSIDKITCPEKMLSSYKQ